MGSMGSFKGFGGQGLGFRAPLRGSSKGSKKDPYGFF